MVRNSVYHLFILKLREFTIYLPVVVKLSPPSFSSTCSGIFRHVLMVLEMVFLQVLCATVEDEPRFRDLIGQWISEGLVPEFPAFVGESEKKRQSRKRRYKEEAKEAEEALREMGADTSECE